MSNKVLNKVLFACLIIYLGLFSITYFKKYAHHNTITYPLNYNWYYSLNGKSPVILSLPTHIHSPYKKGDTVDLYTELPITTIKKPYLHTTLYLQQAKIFLDDKLIFEYTDEHTGSGEIVAPLLENYANKTLHIQYKYMYDDITNYLFPITLKDKDLKTFIFYDRFQILYINSFLFLWGLIFLCYGLQKKNKASAHFIYLGLFGMNTSLWFLCNRKCLQLFITDLWFIHNLEYFTFYALFIPIWGFFYDRMTSSRARAYCLAGLISSTIFFVISSCLHFLNYCNYFEFLTHYHLLLIIYSVMLMLLVIFLLYQHHPLSKGVLIGFLILALSGILELIKYYSTNIHIHSFFNIGMILFTICLCYFTLSHKGNNSPKLLNKNNNKKVD